MATATLNPAQEPLDTTVRLVTPERITFQYPLAGPFRRAVAYLIDLMILGGLYLAALVTSMALALGSSAGMGLFLPAFFALYFGYGATCEALLNGQTPGKRALGIRVVSDQGVPITGAQAFLRNLLWAFDGIWPFAYLPAVACMLLTRRFQRLGDLAAGTMVIVEERPHRGGVLRVDEAEVAALLPWLPVRVAAGPELARTLADYVRHRRRFGRARREEMAAHLALPVRARMGLPAGASSDAIVCALYHRVFLGD
ncbi:MAG TPA: RDD family protein [Isosphaeraceae bacterium]